MWVFAAGGFLAAFATVLAACAREGGGPLAALGVGMAFAALLALMASSSFKS